MKRRRIVKRTESQIVGSELKISRTERLFNELCLIDELLSILRVPVKIDGKHVNALQRMKWLVRQSTDPIVQNELEHYELCIEGPPL